MLPADKLTMFADWWNNDIRFEKTVPHSFEEGYLLIENKHGQTVEMYSSLIKTTAKTMKTTYRKIEQLLQGFLNNMEKITLYFKFISNDTLFVESYGANNILLSNITLTIGNTKEAEPRIRLYDKISINDTPHENMDDVLNDFNKQFVYYLVTCLWYMATSTNNVKYVYEEKIPVIKARHKNIVQVSDTKYIKAPVYDMSKIRKVKVEKLITRKKGWTYSHSFQVHGHYRHYKDGKTIFIESYIKGKGKPFKTQTTILNPEKIKEG